VEQRRAKKIKDGIDALRAVMEVWKRLARDAGSLSWVPSCWALNEAYSRYVFPEWLWP
jgi:hypothetical protein